MLVFNQTTTPYNGLIQRCEVNVYGEDALGKISGSATLLGLWTTRLNQAKLKMDSIVLASDGQWQHDDKNHTALPTITANIVANQREYSFYLDEQDNVIQEILRVYYKTNGSYVLLEPIDETKTPSIYDGQNTTGTPTSYGKKGNTIVLDLVPASNVTDGLKLEITREGYYFLTTDTTKTPGYGMYDYFIADLATFEYSRMNSIANVNLNAGYIEQTKAEIEDYFSRRNQDVRPRLQVTQHNNK